jgi:hypothetical protein
MYPDEQAVHQCLRWGQCLCRIQRDVCGVWVGVTARGRECAAAALNWAPFARLETG